MVDELGLVERIDQLLPKDEECRTLSQGQAVNAMIINGLGFNQRALYLSPMFFQDKPVARLTSAGIEADHVNDDFQGRTLRHLPAWIGVLLFTAVSTGGHSLEADVSNRAS